MAKTPSKNSSDTLNINLALSGQVDVKAYRAEIEATKKAVNELKKDLKAVSDISKSLTMKAIYQSKGGLGQYNQGQAYRAEQSVGRMSQLGQQGSPERMRDILSLSSRIEKTYEKQDRIQMALGLKLGTQAATLRKITDSNELIARIEATKVRRNLEFGEGNQKAVKAMERQLAILQEQLVAQQKITAEAARTLAERQRAANQPAKDRESAARSRSMSEQRLLGDGGASLFKIQTGLLANYTIINALQNGFRQAIAFTVELDNALRNLQAIVKVTDNGMVSLRESLIKVSEGSRFSATEVVNAAVTLGQAGFSGAQIEESIKAITLLATATGTDLAKAVDIATSIMGIFNLEASRMTEVSNTLTQAMNLSKLDIEKLTLGIQYAGNTAYDVGVSFEELTAGLGAMANAGIRSGSTLGTGMRQILVSLEKPSENFQKSLSKLGLTTYDVDVKTKGLYGVLKTLKDAGFGASDAINSFEVRSAAAFIAVSNNLETMSALEDSFYGSSAAAEANDTQMRSLSSQFKNFTSILGTLAADGLQPMLLGLRDGFKAINAFLVKLRENGDVLREWTTIAIAGVAALAGFKVISLVQGLLIGMIPTFGTLRSSLIAATLAFQISSVTMGTFSATVMAAGMALRAAFVSVMPVLLPLFAAYQLGMLSMGQATSAFDREQALLANNIDKAKAAIDRQKGTIDSYKQKMGEVDGKISQLINRQKELQKDSGELAREISHVRRQFADMGYNLSTVDGNISGVIGKLVALRAQLAQDYTLAINVQIGNLAALQGLTAASISSDLNSMSGIDTSALSPEQLSVVNELKKPNLSQEQRAQYQGKLSRLLAATASASTATETVRSRPGAAGTTRATTDAATAQAQTEAMSKALETTNRVLSSGDLLTSLGTQDTQIKAEKMAVEQRAMPNVAPLFTDVERLKVTLKEGVAKIEKDTVNRPSDRLSVFNTFAEKQIAAIDAQIEATKNSPILVDANKNLLIQGLEEAKGLLTGKGQEYAPAAYTREKGSLNLKAQVQGDAYTDSLRYLGKADTPADVNSYANEARSIAQLQYNTRKAELMVGIPKDGPIDAETLNQIDQLALKLKNDRKEIDQAAKDRIETLNKPKDGGGGGGTDNSFQNMMNDFKTGIDTAAGDLKYGDTTAPAAVAQMDGIISKAREELEIRRATMETLAVGSAEYNAAKKEENQLLTFIRENEVAIRDLKEEQGLAQFDLTKSIQEWANQNLNIAAGFEEGFSNVLSSMKSGLSSLFSDLVNGTKTAKEAFRDFGLSVVQSIQNVIAEMLAMYVMKKVLGMFGQTLGGAGGMEMVPLPGGNMTGGAVRKARGGMIEGNLARDSKLHNLMPGEYVLRKSAVDMIGVDALNKMNSMGNRAMASGGHVGVAKQEKGPLGNTNVYVVSPDQQPVPGPSDIIAIINDDIARGGSTKRLIKTVSMGY